MDHVAHRDVTLLALVPTFTFSDVTRMWCCMFLLRFDLFLHLCTYVVNVILFQAETKFGMRKRLSDILKLFRSFCDGGRELQYG